MLHSIDKDSTLLKKRCQKGISPYQSSKTYEKTSPQDKIKHLIPRPNTLNNDPTSYDNRKPV